MLQELTLTSWLQAIRLEPDESVKFACSGDKWEITRETFQISFGLGPGSTRDILDKISSGGVCLAALAAKRHLAETGGGPVEQIGRLWRQGLLVKVVYDGHNRVGILHNYGEADLLAEAPDHSSPIVMTEDTCLRRADGKLLIESVSCGAYFSVTSEKLSQLPIPWTRSMLCREWAQAIGLREEVMMAVASCLSSMGAIRSVDSISASSAAVNHWSFADRMIHARSRLGRHIGDYGRKARVQGTHDGPIASSPPSRTKIDLPRPDMKTIVATDRTFADVLESRRSRREPGETPLGKEQLSEFLYRSARVTGCLGHGEQEITLRPYPSGGGLHELEIYPLVHRCRDLDPGLYRYDPFLHCLEHVANPSPKTLRLLTDARRGSRMAAEPQVLFLITARFARVNTKYQSVTYSLTLKNLGGLFQTMYLVATAMDLAACALGGGNSDLFCRIAGTDFWQESTVGEFLLAKGNAA